MTPLVAQQTRQWTTSTFEEMERGTPDGVAIRSDGQIEAGPALSIAAAVPGSYVWSVAEDARGVAYAGLGGSAGGSAAVLRVQPNNSAQKIFTGNALGVQSISLSPDGTVYAATSPDGKVYRLGDSTEAATVIFDPAQTEAKPKYLWDLAVGSDGTVYVATGAPAAVYRITPREKKPTLLFRTADQHIRSLLLTPDNTLWAGSDGAGVVYRFDLKQPGAKPFAAYAAGRREITSLATDATGSIYLAAVGGKGSGSLPPLPVTGTVGITVTFVQPGSTSAAGSNGVVPDGSEIDRIAPDGTPEHLLTLREDVVYGLLARGGQVLAATGNRGRVYRLDPNVPGRFTELARLEAGQGTAIAGGPADVLVGASNSGKLIRLRDAPENRAVYTSETFDAGQFSRWGRVSTEASHPAFDLSIRTGNVPSTVEGWSDWVPLQGGEPAGVPSGRYAQWRAAMRPGGALDSVTLNFLPRNVPPVVDEVVVAPGARVQAGSTLAGPPTVQVILPTAASPAQAINLVQQDAGTAPLTAQKDRTAITVRWAAHDDNGDDLMFGVWYRGLGEANWHLLKDQLSERFLSFDATLLPDGRYESKVVASDAPDHTDADTLTGDRISAAFLIDTTPPVPGPLSARVENGKLHWTFQATDALSPIAHAEFSIDAGSWQYVVPVGGLSDSLTERYDTTVPLPSQPADAAFGIRQPAEHVLAVRVYDRAENMTSIKTVAR